MGTPSVGLLCLLRLSIFYSSSFWILFLIDAGTDDSISLCDLYPFLSFLAVKALVDLPYLFKGDYILI